MDTQKPSKLFNLADQDYRRAPGVSKSSLDWFARSPAHYKHVIIDGNRPAPTAAMLTGSAFDCLLLTPELFAATYAVAPEMRRGTKAWDEFEAAHSGKTIIKQGEFDQLKNMVEAVMSHRTASTLLSNGQSQVSYFWHDAPSGLACKGRADYVRSDGILVDVKTTQDASPRGFASSCASFRYFVQAAMYLEGEAQATGKATDQFCFVAVEKEAPHAVAVYTLDHAALALGFESYRRELMRLAHCLVENHWPSYAEGVSTLQLPKWAFGGSDVAI